jgi:elongation factor G
MSLSASLVNVTWQDRKINLIDAPGDAGFQGDAIAALTVVEGELVVVSGVMGVEVGTGRTWHRGEDGPRRARRRREHARPRARRLLPRPRGAPLAARHPLRRRAHPVGVEHELTGIVDVLHMCAYTSPEGQKEGARVEIPAELADQANEYREKLLDAVVETDEGLMERYLDGQELSEEEVATALKKAVARGEVFPVAAAVATKNLGTTALLDLLVEGVPGPDERDAPFEVEGANIAAFVFKTIADPFAGRINVFRVLKGTITTDTTLTDTREHAKERMGTLMTMQGKDHVSADSFGEGDIGAVAKLKDVKTGDVLIDKEVAFEARASTSPSR